jgi:hypothetical protein
MSSTTKKKHSSSSKMSEATQLCLLCGKPMSEHRRVSKEMYRVYPGDSEIYITALAKACYVY